MYPIFLYCFLDLEKNMSIHCFGLVVFYVKGELIMFLLGHILDRLAY